MNNSGTPQPDSSEDILLEYAVGNRLTSDTKAAQLIIKEPSFQRTIAKLDEYYTNKFLEVVNDPTKGSKWIPADISTYKSELRQAIKQLSKKGE